MNPKISVVLSTYNHLNYLPQSIYSILGQSISAFLEFIVLDDGSTDGTWNYLKKALGGYCFPLKHEENLGVQKSYHELLSKAKGEYLIFVHSDDIYKLYMLSRLLEVLEKNSKGGLAYGAFQWIDKDENILSTVRNQYVGYHQLLVENPGMSAVLMRRSVYEEVGGYNPDIGCRADQDLYLRILEKSKAVYVDKILSLQRLDDKCKSTQDQITGETDESFERLRANAIERRIKNREPGPPRILFVVSSLPISTGESLQIHIKNTKESLEKEGYEVFVLQRGFSEIIEGIGDSKNHSICYSLGNDLMSQIENKKAEDLFIKFLDKQLPYFDIIHFHHLIGFPMSFIDIAKKCGYLVILSLYDLWMLCPELGNKTCVGQISIENCAKCLMKGKQVLYVNEIANYYYQVAYRRAYFEYISRKIDIIIPNNFEIYNIFKNLGISHLDPGAPTLDEVYKELLR